MRDRGNGLAVTVVVPCHNGEAYVGACLESILSQDPMPDEVVFVDDGSTDNSAAIARRFGPRLRYHHQPRQGAGAARNVGIGLATCDCIGFLDADDLWPAGSLGTRLAVLEADSAVASVTGLIEHFRTGDASPQEHARPMPIIQPTRQVGAMLVRRAVFNSVGVFDASGRLGEQFDWVARLADSGLTAVALERVVLRRRIHASNTGISESNRRSEYLHILKSLIDRRRAADRPPTGQA